MTERKQGLATVAEASEFLRIGRVTIYQMYTSGELPTVKVRNARRIPWSALYAIVDSACLQTGEEVEEGDSSE